MELCQDVFVPNDTLINEEYSSMLITGANASGKSIYLTQVALIVYLAHLGCFVPALSASIGLTPSITACLQICHSNTMGSTFAIDLQAVSKVFEADCRSLVLLDEFGQGTATHGNIETYNDGIGIFCALLNHLCTNNKPHILASTHYHGIFYVT